MRKTSFSKIGVMLLGIVGCLLFLSQVAMGDFTFGTPTNLGSIVNGSDDVAGVSISADGQDLYFVSNRSGGYGNYDLWVTVRPTTDDEWSEPTNLGPIVNSHHACMGPSISADGLTLYFSDMDYNKPYLPGGVGSTDTWMVTRETTDAPWSSPVNIGQPVNYTGGDITPTTSADGLSLYFARGTGPVYLYDLFLTTRATTNDPWSAPVNMGSTVNSTAAEFAPSISADRLILFFCRTSVSQSYYDLWMMRRATVDDEWDPPVKLGFPDNTSAAESFPSISADGTTLYFCSGRPGGFGQWDIWQVSIQPVVDLNGSGIVDAEDVCIITDYWGTDEPLCDIGPMPWGDGVVDVQDLIVLAEHLFEEIPSPGQGLE